ncbi:hypothetical protein NCAS_0B02200 [Naumovozyma castellii]|uniref:TFIID subunit TAF5 NTD2 domain-containing protein n=1 Tax=Naumovozyma castellii TaxID=27288 RepID=G0VBH8_NAUCA|nr:hypothetical protein NCAS_0B02200 [Naumovozyma castellii CBS 4309]CCC68304.1 hypothetical protein NCAS_0B02200 [Naumovozyma castellii CBS 4309]
MSQNHKAGSNSNNNQQPPTKAPRAGNNNAQRSNQQPQQPQQPQQRTNGPFSASDLNRIVLEYLNKKGYHRTEAMLRAESGRTLTPQDKQSPANTQTGKLPEPSTMAITADKGAKPVSNPHLPLKRNNEGGVVSNEELNSVTSPESYIRAYSMLKSWVDSSLEIYRPELHYILYPIFIYLFLNLVIKDPVVARRFFDKFSSDFRILHGTEINRLFSVNSVDHIKENEVASAFQSNRYRITISRTTLNLLLYFLNENESVGGSLIIGIINQHLDPNVMDVVLEKEKLADGIKLLSDGNAGKINSELNSAEVKLGPFPKDEEFVKEIETELKIKDDQERQQQQQNGTTTDASKRTLMQEYKAMNNEPYETPVPTDDSNKENNEQDKENTTDKAQTEQDATTPAPTSTLEPPANTTVTVKTEEKSTTSSKPVIAGENLEAPSKDILPLPPKTALDLKLEIQKVKESRDSIKLDNLQAALPSVCMYTFHNTNGGMTSLQFSEDSRLVAAGFQDSYIKLWSLDGSSLKQIQEKSADSINTGDMNDNTSTTLIGHSGAVYSTSFSPDNRYLLSGSEDKTVRLWSTDTYTSLVSYKGHNHPVWDVQFSPLGHYFATASHDQTARLWSCDHIYPLRIFAGHLSDVDCVSFHPNGCYVFTGSSDKTCRMWDISTGDSVRLFLGHTAPVLCTAVSPDGRWLATGSEDGIINLWDIGTAKRLKVMRGHGKNAIHSLSYCKEGNVLVSGGADHSVRVWDLKKSTAEPGPEPEEQFVGYIGNLTASINQDIKDFGRRRTIIPSNDLVASFYTKKTPIFNVKFTRNNIVLAGGAFRE